MGGEGRAWLDLVRRAALLQEAGDRCGFRRTVAWPVRAGTDSAASPRRLERVHPRGGAGVRRNGLRDAGRSEWALGRWRVSHDVQCGSAGPPRERRAGVSVTRSASAAKPDDPDRHAARAACHRRRTRAVGAVLAWW